MFRNDDFHSFYSTAGFLLLKVLTHSPTSFMDVDEGSPANTAPWLTFMSPSWSQADIATLSSCLIDTSFYCWCSTSRPPLNGISISFKTIPIVLFIPERDETTSPSSGISSARCWVGNMLFRSNLQNRNTVSSLGSNAVLLCHSPTYQWMSMSVLSK